MAVGESPFKGANILMVDDEESILNSLKRSFRKTGWNIKTATSGFDGLDILALNPIDVVISDMRMPEMNGAEFLEQVAKKYPQTVRILLTGFSELDSAIDAINKGRIYSYVSKPWNDEQFCQIINNALQLGAISKERDTLLEVTERQNKELSEFNAQLEQKVKARTQELEQTAAFLDQANTELKNSYNSTIRVFSNLIELREGKRSGHSRRVAQYAKNLAESLNISEQNTNDVYLAALLHNIGLVGLPDVVSSTPICDLTFADKEKFKEHPVLGEAALMSIPFLHNASKYIRHHREYFNGSGFPDQLSGNEIPIGARIVTVLNEFDELQMGFITGKPETPHDAVEYLKSHVDVKYDRRVVDTFLKYIKPTGNNSESHADGMERTIDVNEVADGMKLARDLVTPGGILLLAKGQRITQAIIERIRVLEKDTKKKFAIFITD